MYYAFEHSGSNWNNLEVLSFVLLFAGEGTNSPRTRRRKAAVGVRDATSGCAGGRTQTEGAGEGNGNDKNQGRS